MVFNAAIPSMNFNKVSLYSLIARLLLQHGFGLGRVGYD